MNLLHQEDNTYPTSNHQSCYCFAQPILVLSTPSVSFLSNSCKIEGNDRRTPVLMSLKSIPGAPLLLGFVAATIAFHPFPAESLGVGSGLLDNCQPARLTCISSQDDTPTSFLEPWEYDEDLAGLQARIEAAVLEEQRATVVVRQPRYLRFEIPTANSAHCDDIEFFFPIADNVVHFRSARRDKSFDFLLNRRRLERLRQKLGLAQIPVLRNRMSAISIFETPFDSFGPSAVDVDALIDNRGVGSRPVR